MQPTGHGQALDKPRYVTVLSSRLAPTSPSHNCCRDGTLHNTNKTSSKLFSAATGQVAWLEPRPISASRHPVLPGQGQQYPTV